MTVTMVEIRDNEAQMRPLFGGDLLLRDALGTYARLLWPTNTAKQAAREWELTLDEAKGLIASRASQLTIDKVLKHRNGGWAVVLPIMGAVIGHGLDDFLAAEQRRLQLERERYEAEAARLGTMAREVGSLLGLGRRGSPELDAGRDRPRRSGNGGMGRADDARAVETKSFDPRRRP